MKPCYVKPFKVKEIPRYMTTDKYVGLLLITYNDEENLKRMLPSLEETVDYPTYLYVCDMGSSDSSAELVEKWYEENSNTNIYGMTIKKWEYLESLTKTMNHAFRELMCRQETEFLGWVHPDAEYKEGWLSQLISTLQRYPNIGKICSYNIRDGLPQTEELIPGHEQIYLLRKGVIFKIGLFDEQFLDIFGWEDIDHDRRVIQEGWGVFIDPKSYVHHFGMGTRSKRDTASGQMYNASLYTKKWGDSKHGEIYLDDRNSTN